MFRQFKYLSQVLAFNRPDPAGADTLPPCGKENILKLRQGRHRDKIEQLELEVKQARDKLSRLECSIEKEKEDLEEINEVLK